MKSRETLIKLRRFEVNEKRQKITDIETMILDFRRLVDELDHQIKVEQENSGIEDVNHFAYPPYAKAATQRRNNLLCSIADLELKLEEARIEMEQALEELTKAEMADERDSGERSQRSPQDDGGPGPFAKLSA